MSALISNLENMLSGPGAESIFNMMKEKKIITTKKLAWMN
jgi:hypothetical protein